MTAVLERAATDWWPADAGPAPRFATRRSPERKTFGPAIARISAAAGKPMFPWQRYVVDVANEVLPDGSYAYDVVVITVPRRGGKTFIVVPLVAHRCGQPARARVWMTAQKRESAVARWRDASDALLATSLAPKLRQLIGTSHESLTWQGSRSVFRPFAPNGDDLHGEEPDVVIVDELWSFTLEQKRNLQGGYRPAWSVKAGQEWLLSTAGTRASEWLRLELARGRDAVLADRRSGIAYFEWSIPEVVGGVPVGELPDDELLDLVLECHPRRDHGLRAEFLRAELEDLKLDPRKGRDEFIRAYGNLEAGSGSDSDVFSDQVLGRAQASERIPADARVALSFEVDPGRVQSSVSAVWRNPVTGVAVAELLRSDRGVRWLADYVLQVRACNRVGAIGVNYAGPARDVADELELAGVEPLKVSAGGQATGELLRLSAADYAAACSRFSDEISEDFPTLTVDPFGWSKFVKAVGAASRRRLRSGDVWDSRGVAPITELVSHTVALRAFDHMPPESTRYGWAAY